MISDADGAVFYDRLNDRLCSVGILLCCAHVLCSIYPHCSQYYVTPVVL